MSSSEFDVDYVDPVTLGEVGPTLVKHGYQIIPVKPKSKRPSIESWTEQHADSRQVRKWIESGMSDHGVGITTLGTPIVDVDVYDEAISEQIQAWCEENIGVAPVRIGLAPKRALLYRAEEPFRKVLSRAYYNDWDEKCRVEIQSDGQHFVAYGIHPDTQCPYTWASDEHPMNTPIADLPVISRDQAMAVAREFERLAEEAGWRPASAKKSPTGSSGAADSDDVFAADVMPVSISEDDLFDRLMEAPGAEDYETWVQVGMALFHQFEGDDAGLEMWHAWSELAPNYDKSALDDKWSSFDVSDKRRAPVTARFILKLAKDAAEGKMAQIASELRDAFAQARDFEEWQAAAREAQKAEIDHLARATIVSKARDALETISGTKIGIAEVRRKLAYELNANQVAKWCENWVYDSADDRFFNVETKQLTTSMGFNAMNGRNALTKKDRLDGKVEPSHKASDLALNLYQIPVVDGRRYAPGEDAVYHMDGMTFANTYPENQVPRPPKAIRPIDRINIKRIKAHFKHLLDRKDERRHLLDWISYIVQNPGKRVNYAVLLQGTQGDGKSFFAFLLRAVMGPPNVRMMNAHILESAFTDWAEGQCVAAIEEIRLIGHNRYDLMNRMKPLITNQVIEVHPKGRGAFNTENTTNYIMFTNYRDAMPLSDNERRFLVLFSRWQDGSSIRQFKAENPDYYRELYGALQESAPAIREWLLSVEQSEGFDPEGDAPITAAFNYMARCSQQPEIQQLMEYIEEGIAPDISEELLNFTKFQDMLQGGDYDGPIAGAKTLNRVLENAGFWPLGRVKFGSQRLRFYSRKPDLWMTISHLGDRTLDVSSIRSFMEKEVFPLEAKEEAEGDDCSTSFDELDDHGL